MYVFLLNSPEKGANEKHFIFGMKYINHPITLGYNVHKEK